MSANLNRVEVIGRLGKDPVTRFTPTGKKVVTFTLAANRNWKNEAGEKVEKTDWFNCECWNGTADAVANYLTKGRLVFVEGRLQTDEYNDNDNQRRWYTKIVATNIQFLDGPKAVTEEDVAALQDDGIPF